MTKMTYVKALEIAMESVTNEEVKEKLEALKASIAKKNGAERKQSATQKANESLKEIILGGMESGKGYTITDLIKTIEELSELSNQKVSALVRQLVECGKITKEEIKRKSYFTKVD